MNGSAFTRADKMAGIRAAVEGKNRVRVPVLVVLGIRANGNVSCWTCEWPDKRARHLGTTSLKIW
jgi:hypothetical protein